MKKVLIVDDNVSFTEFLDATIRAAGHETCVVHNGADAVEAFGEQHPDLVFLDVLLPKLDGFKVCQKIRSDRKGGASTPIVMMTGIYTKRAYQRDAVRTYGASDYLVKPFAITEIWQVLERQLGEAIQAAPTVVDQPADLIADDSSLTLGGVSLKDRPLGLVLADLHKEQRTGLLFLKGDVTTDVFFIEKGELVFVRSSDTSQRLDKLLEQAGVLDAEQVAQARALLVESRGQSRMGQILVSLGFLTEESLQEAVQGQLRRRIHVAFQNECLGFTFVEGPLPEEEDIRVHLDMANVILEGIRAMPETDTFEKHLPPLAEILSRGSQPSESLHLTGFEKQVLELANGNTSVGQALALGKLAEIDAARTLFALLCLGAIDAAGPDSEEHRDSEENIPAPEADDRQEKRRPFPLPPQGDLKLLPPSRVLATLHACGHTGILELRGNQGSRWVYMDRGKIVFARSDDPTHRLGEVLVSGGLLSEEARARVSRDLEASPGKRLGQLLVEEGLLGLEELQWAVVFQVQKIVSGVLGWTEGRYSYKEGALPTEETITLELRTLDLLIEGLRRIPGETASRYLPKPQKHIGLVGGAEEKLQALRLTAQERDFLKLLTERTSLDGIRRRHVFSDEFVAVNLHMLSALGMLEVLDSEEAPKPQETGFDLLEDLASEAEEVTQTEPVSRRRARVPSPQEQSGPDGNNVPRFLYDQLLKERRGLEATLYEKRLKLGEAREAALQAKAILENFRENVLKRGDKISVSRLDPILEEVAELCGGSAESIGENEATAVEETS